MRIKYYGKELDRIHGLNHYDYSAKQYDPARLQFTTRDPHSENYYSWSPYAYVANNPVRLIDKNGKDWTDILSGATDAINNNISIGLTDAVGINQQFQAISASDYNTGRIIGDVASIVIGAASLTGVGAVIGIPLAAEGAVLTTHGVGRQSATRQWSNLRDELKQWKIQRCS